MLLLVQSLLVPVERYDYSRGSSLRLTPEERE